MDLSLVVIARNEEERIGECLSSVPFADEKLVVDSGSTDRTADAAREHGARVLFRPFDSWSGQKSWAASQAAGDWILSLDADESLDPELASAIEALIRGGPPLDAYRLRFRVVFEGAPMRFGPWSGETHLRLYRKGAASYGREQVHEGLSTSRRVGGVRPGFVIHRSWESGGEMAEKMERYARLWAEANSARYGGSPGLRPILRPAWRLFSGYVLKGGFLEGARGWRASVACARYVRRKWRLLRETGAQGPAMTREPGSTPSVSQTGEDEPGT